jgi:alkanesulfonate monooxygenase
MHVLNHKGKYFSVRGPLNIARPVQGWPVIVQAGASEAGRQLAAETAEVCSRRRRLADGKAFYADVKGRMDGSAATATHLKILPGAFVVVGDSVEEAKAKRALLDSLVHYDSAIASLSIACWAPMPPASIPTGPCRRSPRPTPARAAAQRVVDLAARDKLTVRQLAQRVGGYGGLAFVGTPQTIADEMEEWLTRKGCDGFNVMFPFLPEGLDDFVDKVVPELQRRGLFRGEYEG